MNLADEVVRGLMRVVLEQERQLGRKLDWERHLPPGRDGYTTREICNAVGLALTEAGVQNNLWRPAV